MEAEKGYSQICDESKGSEERELKALHLPKSTDGLALRFGRHALFERRAKDPL